MKFDGVILYGPPASGKDTLTEELCRRSEIYAYFEKLKVGPGRTKGYRLVTESGPADLRDRRLIVHEVTRYGATYAVDSPHLDMLLNGDRVPIVHMGQLDGIDALRRSGRRWLDVLLWCSKETAENRIRARGSADINSRLAIWDETLADIGTQAEPLFTLSIRSDLVSAATAAKLVHAVMTGS